MAGDAIGVFLHRLNREMQAAALEQLPDRELAERFLAGRDAAVFAAIVQRHGPMVYRVCWRVLRQEQDAEDAFQATFLLLARNLQTVRKHASLASWLHGVARRVALKAKTQAAMRRRHEQQAVPAVLPDDLPWGEVRQVLDTELAALPEKWRLPLILCHLESRTQDEAAEQLGWGKSTLRRRLEEARDALARRLRRRGVGPAALAAALLADCLGDAAPSALLLETTITVGAMGIVPAPAVHKLLEGVRVTMPLTRLQIGITLLAASLLTLGIGFAIHHALAAPAAPQVQGQPPAAPAGQAQQEASPEEIKKLIAQLRNEDIDWDHHNSPTLKPRVQGEPAKALLKIGRPAGEALMEALHNPQKFAAAHVLLTLITDPPFPSLPSLHEGDVKLAQWNHLHITLGPEKIDFHPDQGNRLGHYWQGQFWARPGTGQQWDGVPEGMLFPMDPKKPRQAVKILQGWGGALSVRRRMTEGEPTVVADEKAWAKLWQAWRGDAPLPQVDFRQELVLVVTTEGPNRIMLSVFLDGQGDISFASAATAVAGSAFGYLMVTIPRAGVKTVQGKPLDAPPAAGPDEATALVAQLRNEDITWDYSGRVPMPQVKGNAVAGLGRLKYRATPALLKALEDPQKFAAAHVLLTAWYHDGGYPLPIMDSYLAIAGRIVQWNHLRVQFRSPPERIAYFPEQRHELGTYWKRRLEVPPIK